MRKQSHVDYHIGYKIATPFGPASLAFDSAGALTRLTLARDGALNPQDGGAPAPDPATLPVPSPDPALPDAPAALPEPAREVVRQLAEYFAGARREFTVPLSPQGTPFQLAVWDELTRIPYGSTITYGELAARLGDPQASRAVGRANGLNPIWIIIPCHRVIGADGSLTGYAGGIEVKRALLEHEGALKPRGGNLFE
jgi:O-6-methylguanine DNA methyltransferase